jgi:D-alanyl-D-alanine carboxypeptidase (penicillin-binding protein 5/6)
MDAVSGQVLCTLQPEQRMFPASLTKMMTAILAAERLRPEAYLTVPAEAAQVGETSLNLKAGQRVTVRDLLTGAILKSANDAAATLAVQMAGSQAAFAVLMNQKAAELGLRGTRFCNPHGLHDPGHYTTAADLAIIARCFWMHRLLRDIAGLRQANLPSLPGEQGGAVWNHNRLIQRWNECTGIKAGYTRQAGNCLASSARRNGWDLICVVLKSSDVWDDSKALLEWGFTNFRRVTPTAAAAAPCQVRVWGGEQDYVAAALAGAVSFVVPRGAPESWQLQLYPQDQQAPVHEGQTVGCAVVRMPGQPERRLPLVALGAVAEKRAPLPTTGGLWGLLLMSGAVLLYGTASKTLGARRARVPAGQRAAYSGGAGHGGRAGGLRPLHASRPRPQRGAAGRAAGPRTYHAPVRPAEQAPRRPDGPA